MVSGLVTSPCDQLRIFSGDARLMRIASKSAMGFAMSKGLERYKVFLRFLRVLTRPLTAPENYSLVVRLQATGKPFWTWRLKSKTAGPHFSINTVAASLGR